MIYVTWGENEEDGPNVLSFDDYKKAKEFCDENGLDPEETIDIMNW